MLLPLDFIVSILYWSCFNCFILYGKWLERVDTCSSHATLWQQQQCPWCSVYYL